MFGSSDPPRVTNLLNAMSQLWFPRVAFVGKGVVSDIGIFYQVLTGLDVQRECTNHMVVLLIFF